MRFFGFTQILQISHLGDTSIFVYIKYGNDADKNEVINILGFK